MFGTIHRKSAVELLQESKASYVKSEMVLDRKQELRHSKHLQISSPIILHSPTLVLRKSPSSELWKRGHHTPNNECSSKLLDLFHVSTPSIYATSARRRRRSPPPRPPPPDEDQVLVDQLQRALRRGPPERTCTCHVVFKKVTAQSHQPSPKVIPKSPKRQSRAARHRADSASRDQLQIKLRRLLGDEENEELQGFGVSQSQQHKSMPDLRASLHGSDYRKQLNSPGLSLRSAEGAAEDNSISPAFTVPEISWRFFDDEPITLRAPEGFRDKETDEAFEDEVEPEPLDPATIAKLDRFFGQLGQHDDSLSLSSEGSSPVFFESVGSADTPYSSDGTDPPRFAGLTSVVERNARIIKWLCNCRKAGLPAACMPS